MTVLRRAAVCTVALAVATAAVGLSAGGPQARVKNPKAGAFRAFTADSWWNTPVPANAPKSPISDQILKYMQTAPDAGGGCLKLAGTGGNKWGQPVYWAAPTDPSYNIKVNMSKRPPELASIRIPARASAAATSDAAMTVFDKQRGYVTAFSGAKYNAATQTWSASGATVTYLNSKGLHWRTGRTDDLRNQGSHRGNNGATMMVRYDEVQAGAINHVLKVTSGPETSTRFAFPMVGSDGDSGDPVAPRQGLRFRIKPSVDVAALKLGPQATVIALALQRYGMYLGDNGGNTILKLEDTQASGHAGKWALQNTALCKIPLSSRYWDVVEGGYDPSR